jgi:hypothetical protein
MVVCWSSVLILDLEFSEDCRLLIFCLNVNDGPSVIGCCYPFKLRPALQW